MEKARWKISVEEAKTLGQTLRSIKSKKSEGSSFDEELWFQGDEKYFNVFVGITNRSIQWIQMTFRGAYLELKEGKLVTGTTTDYQGSAMDGTPSKMLNRDQNLNKLFISTAMDILVSGENEETIAKCVEAIKASNKNN